MEIYRKHRPSDWSEVFGQESVVKMLQRLLMDHDEVPHAYIATGPSGCGKTTILRILANKLDCGDHDLSEINCADFRGLDTIREIRSKMTLKPFSGKCRVWILDESHRLPVASQSILLKMLEDPPKHVYFMLATTDPQSMLKTIRTRCTELKIKLLSDPVMEKMLDFITKKTKIKISRDVKEKITDLAGGSARQALVLLHQISKLDDSDEMLNALEKSSYETESIKLCRALFDTRTQFCDVQKILAGLTEDEESMRRMVMGYAGKVMSGNNARNWHIAYEIIRSFNKPFYDSGQANLYASCYEVVVRTRQRAKAKK